MAIPERRTVDGFEMQFATNHLGHFALTNLLLSSVTDRVVTVSSGAHRSCRIVIEDLNWERRRYRAWAAYGQSKLASLLFTLELQRRLTAAGSSVRACTAAAPKSWPGPRNCAVASVDIELTTYLRRRDQDADNARPNVRTERQAPAHSRRARSPICGRARRPRCPRSRDNSLRSPLRPRGLRCGCKPRASHWCWLHRHRHDKDPAPEVKVGSSVRRVITCLERASGEGGGGRARRRVHRGRTVWHLRSRRSR
jgi:hypothetical protein